MTWTAFYDVNVVNAPFFGDYITSLKTASVTAVLRDRSHIIQFSLLKCRYGGLSAPGVEQPAVGTILEHLRLPREEPHPYEQALPASCFSLPWAAAALLSASLGVPGSGHRIRGGRVSVRPLLPRCLHLRREPGPPAS